MSRLVADLRGQRYQEVERSARALVAQHPNSGLLWKFLGVSLGMQGKEALHALQQAATLLPEDAEAAVNLGNALRAAGRLEEAVTCYRRAIEISPDFAVAHGGLGGALRGLGQFGAAAASYRRALQLQPGVADAHCDLGNALTQLGQLDAAVSSYRRAIEIAPNFAEAHNNLGNALLELGQPQEALTSFRQALAIKPDFAAAHTNLGNALRDLGLLDDALASHRRALEVEPGFAQAGINAGNVLRDLGQYEAAMASYRRVLETEPQSALAQCNLGSALRDLGRIGEAETSFRRALSMQPDYAEAHSNLGVVLRVQNRLQEAEASCRKALEIDPRLAAALVLLAELHADKGEFTEAENLFKRAIEIDPNSSDAWAGIPGLRKMTQDDSAWVIEAQRLASRRQPPRQEAQLRYAVGKYFDDVRDYPLAFANYQRANELAKPCAPAHDRQAVSRVVRQTIDRYDDQWMSRARGAASASARPVFIVGMPRSGTSLAEQILASHGAVFGAGELPFWSQASTNNGSSVFDGGSASSRIGRLGLDYLRLLENLSPDALRVVDKMPSNFLFLGLIHAALPNARIIHMRRNPIDTCLSIYFQNFDVAHSYANDLEDLAHYYSEYLRLMRHWSSSLPKHAMMEVPYEGLVGDQQAWSRKMVEFIGLAWDSRCLEFARTERAVFTRSRWQVRQAINTSSVQRWRNYEKFIGPLLRLEGLDV